MPSIDIAAPVSSAPSDRLVLGVGWVRPVSIGGTLNPSTWTLPGVYFEGNENLYPTTLLGVFKPRCWPQTTLGLGPVACGGELEHPWFMFLVVGLTRARAYW